MKANVENPAARRELLVTLVVTICSAILRFWHFGSLGLTHFDEGVYAAAGAWSLSPRGLAGIDPELIAYAPPGFPVLIGLGYFLLGVSDAIPILVACLAGIATVPVVAWVAARTFGSGAGAAAAVLSGLSLAHVAFSRKALTDVPFLLAWVASIGLASRLLERPGLLRAVLFGASVGVCQNLKYNGWLVFVLFGGAAGLGLIPDRSQRNPRQLVRILALGTVAAITAMVIYLPWYLFVEQHGGYVALVRHHQSYVGGPGTWIPHLRQQLAQVVALSGGPFWGAATWGMAWLATALASCGLNWVTTGSNLDWTRFRIGGLFGAAVVAGFLDLGWWVGAAWTGWLLVDRRPSYRVLGVWWALLSVMTPLYHPYARLWLPLHASGWLLVAGVIVSCGPFQSSVSRIPATLQALLIRKDLIARGIVGVSCLFVAQWIWKGDPPVPLPLASFWQSTTDLRTGVHHLVSAPSFAEQQGVSLRVLARRPVAFYLALEGRVSFRLVPEAKSLGAGPSTLGDWAMVDSALASDSELDRILAGQGSLRYKVVGEELTSMDPVTLLDNQPEAAFQPRSISFPRLRLLRPETHPTVRP